MNKIIFRLLLSTITLSVFLLSSCHDDDNMLVDDQTPVESAVDTLVTPDGVHFVRTPEENFHDLPDWPYAYQYVEIDGLRQAYAEAGPSDGEVVLLLHGQPSWSYLYREMIPILADAGYRVIAMDHLGMGRSDKPVQITDYSYLGHSGRLESFIQHLALSDINLFVQDWGSLIGLRVAGLHPDWFSTISVGNGALPVIPEGFQPLVSIENPDEVEDLASPFANIPAQQVPYYDGCELISEGFDFNSWAYYSMKGASYSASEVVEALTWFDLSDEVEAAYDAPFPSRAYMAGTRTFPALVNEVAGVNTEAWAGLTAFVKPFLTVWGNNDNGSLGSCEAQQTFIENVPGAAGKPHVRLEEAGHFLQSDQGEEVARRLVEFYAVDWEDVSTDPCANFDSPIQNEERSQVLIPPSDLRNFRYGEVLATFECGDELITEVYPTLSFNDCPEDEWYALNAEDLQNDLGAVAIVLNGPRHWMVNMTENNAVNFEKIATFGTLQMGLAARFKGLQPDEKYIEGEVQRSTTFIFNAGNEVYKLINPNGDAYIMQSYSRIIEQDLTVEDLSSLGERLNLPDGWTYETENLSADLELMADGIAIVIQDDLENSYQKILD